METITTARGSKEFWTTIKDGNGNDEKIINFDNEEICPKHGLVEVVPLRERKGYDNNVKFRRVKDRATQCWIGIPESIHDETKKITYRLITLIGRRTYDLSDDRDRKEYMCIKFGPYLEGSPNQDRNSPPLYKVYDKEKQAQENLTKTKLKRRAAIVADGLNGQDLDDMMRACGMGVAGLSEIMKQSAIISFAEQEPEIFLKHWESPARQEAFILRQGVDLNIIQNDLNIGFIYRTIHLGLTEQEAIGYLKSHPNISSAIETLILQKNQETANSNKVLVKTEEVHPDLLAAQNRIKELEAALVKKQAENAIELESGKSLDGPKADPELETLKARAKELKIQGWHLAKNKEDLLKKIEEAEKAKN